MSPLALHDVVAAFPDGWVEDSLPAPMAGVAWMRLGTHRVRAIQNEDSVTLWMSNGLIVSELQLASTEPLAAWIAQAVSLQSSTNPMTAEEHEAHLRETLPPDVEQVLEVLRSGHAIQVGGGRTF